MWIDLESITQSKVTQKEKKQILYINAYMWNLEKWYRYTICRVGTEMQM